MLKLKNGVKAKDLQPQTVLAIAVVNDIYSKYEYDCVVTSLNDSKHSEKSLHYSGFAADFRMNNVHEVDQKKITQLAKENLGGEYDVLLESVGTVNAHLHVEYDPKY